MKKKILFFAGGIAVILAALAIGLMVVNKTDKPSDQTTESSHDASNSDGHHSASSSVEGDVLDLTAQSEVSMDIKDFKYTKPNIKIKKGTTVTWTNQDAMKHNVMAEHENSDQAHDPPTKDQVDPSEFAGPLLAKGESYSFTFSEANTNPYHCSPHPYMKGSVTVVD